MPRYVRRFAKRKSPSRLVVLLSQCGTGLVPNSGMLAVKKKLLDFLVPPGIKGKPVDSQKPRTNGSEAGLFPGAVWVPKNSNSVEPRRPNARDGQLSKAWLKTTRMSQVPREKQRWPMVPN
jgi:hypothetical protein